MVEPELRVSFAVVLKDCTLENITDILNFIENKTNCKLVFMKKSLTKLFITEQQGGSI